MPHEYDYAGLTLARFTEALASAEPVPGGGSAAAVAASLAASLCSMVARLSLDRPRYEPYATALGRALEAGDRLRMRFLELASEDARAYATFSAAMHLPKDTPEQQQERTSRMRAAARRAAQVPLETMERCADLAAEVEALSGRSNVNVASDLAVAALLAEAAAEAAARNVLVNLGAIGDDRMAGVMTVDVDRHLVAVRHLAAQTRERVGRGGLRDPEEP